MYYVIYDKNDKNSKFLYFFTNSYQKKYLKINKKS